jgi:hypothetical protein
MGIRTERSPRSPRWDFLGRYQVRVDGELFLDRLRLVQTPLFAILLTRIYRDDAERDPHNHSRAFCTLILSGSYAERVWPRPEGLALPRSDSWASDVLHQGHERHHGRFSLMRLPQGWAHSITRIDGPLRTLVIAGRHRGTWHFWTADGPVDWKDYG